MPGARPRTERGASPIGWASLLAPVLAAQFEVEGADNSVPEFGR